MGWGTLLEVRDGSWDIKGGTRPAGGPSRGSGTGQEVLWKVRCGLRCLPGGPGLVGRPSQGSGTGGEDLQKMRNRWGGPPEGLG